MPPQACINLPKRVPVFANPQDGISIEKPSSALNATSSGFDSGIFIVSSFPNQAPSLSAICCLPLAEPANLENRSQTLNRMCGFRSRDPIIFHEELIVYCNSSPRFTSDPASCPALSIASQPASSAAVLRADCRFHLRESRLKPPHSNRSFPVSSAQGSSTFLFQPRLTERVFRIYSLLAAF